MEPTMLEYKGFTILLRFYDQGSDRKGLWEARPPVSVSECHIDALYCDREGSYEEAIAAAAKGIDRRLATQISGLRSELYVLEACIRREGELREIVWVCGNRAVAKDRDGFVALSPKSGSPLPGIYEELAGAIAAFEFDVAVLSVVSLQTEEAISLDDLRLWGSAPWKCADKSLSEGEVETILQNAIAAAAQSREV